MGTKFTHLHVHTPYSLLDGFAKIDELLKQTKEQGMDSIAITDHGVMFGVVDFYKQAKKIGIHPIIGSEVYVAQRGMNDKDVIDKKSYHLVLLAENQEGYQNLIKLVSEGFVRGFYYKPRVDKTLMQKYSKGIIALSACLAGEVQQKILQNDYDAAVQSAKDLESIFGKNNFFLEMQDHGIPEQRHVNTRLKRISQETGIPLVITNDVHYVRKNDSDTHEVLLCIQMGKTLEDEHRMEFATDEFYLKSPEEILEIFPGQEEAMENTWKIAQRCRVDFDFDTIHLPEFRVPGNEEASHFLRKLCEKGLKKRYPQFTEEIKNRLEYEISVIVKMGYVDYFLIVWDFVAFARSRKIMVGPGRGSAAGSLVAYCLEITDVDPIKYSLIFERFLNPERISMPDVDIDFCYERRDEVIRYVKEKYHEDHVAQIITFGTLGARAAIRDVGRALAMSYAEVDKVAKEVPFAIGMTIEKALEINPQLKSLCNSSVAIQRLVTMAKSVEGLPRHASTHAAGVVIAKKPVDEYVPLYRNQDAITTQFPMGTLEGLGLLKMDFLGLRTLTVIQDAIAMIEKNHGIYVDFQTVEYDDYKVYQLLSEGNTLGVFQLESSGMRSFMKELRPESFEDIIAGISLYRPGPMDSIPLYIRNKKNPHAISYIDDNLRPILGVTQGIMIYQEQVMQVVRDLAGYSFGRADLVRKAMSKKQMDVMEEERQYFVHGKHKDNGEIDIQGCIRNGILEQAANKIYDDMIDFAKYAFNKSHAACYGVLAYETAWLKTYYPVEFMASLLTSVSGSEDKIVQYIHECYTLGIRLLPPHVNKSDAMFSVEKDQIRFALASIKNVGIKAVVELVEERRSNGDFQSFLDFAKRMSGRDANKRMIESLIKCGAFDELHPNRAALLSGYERILESVSQERKNKISGQLSLFDMANMLSKPDINLPDVREFSLRDKLSIEKEVLGLYLSGHPLDEYKEDLSKASVHTALLKEKQENYESCQHEDNRLVTIGGIIMKKTVKNTKRNDLMAFLTLEDLYGTVELILFPQIFEKYIDIIQEDKVIFVSGRLSLKEDEDPKIIVQKMQEINHLENQKIYIRIDSIQNKPLLQNIEQVIRDNPGKYSVVLYDESSKKSFLPQRYKKIAGEEFVVRLLEGICGEENIKKING